MEKFGKSAALAERGISRGVGIKKRSRACLP